MNRLLLFSATLLCAALTLPILFGSCTAKPRAEGDTFTISGFVARPGRYRLPVNEPQIFSVRQAIRLAGGPALFAQLRKVKVVRKVSGKTQTSIVNVAKVTGDQRGQDMQVQPGDVIIVPEKIPVF
ncbi:MAG TPA: SLBB domain-containing protein [Verrucomicrobium sp.]|nr:SLBB domain-containing protein [Verrucomicrobium sp.]